MRGKLPSVLMLPLSHPPHQREEASLMPAQPLGIFFCLSGWGDRITRLMSRLSLEIQSPDRCFFAPDIGGKGSEQLMSRRVTDHLVAFCPTGTKCSFSVNYGKGGHLIFNWKAWRLIILHFCMLLLKSEIKFWNYLFHLSWKGWSLRSFAFVTGRSKVRKALLELLGIHCFAQGHFSWADYCECRGFRCRAAPLILCCKLMNGVKWSIFFLSPFPVQPLHHLSADQVVQ